MWYHFILTYDGVKSYIFVDGVMKASQDPITAGNVLDFGGSPVTSDLIFNQTYPDATVAKLNFEIDNFRIANVAHSNETTNMFPLAGAFVTKNLNTTNTAISNVSISLSGATTGVSNAIYYSINGGTQWVRLPEDAYGRFFYPAEGTNFTGASNDLRVKVVSHTEDDRTPANFSALNVNYYNTEGNNTPQPLSLEGLVSRSSYTSKDFIQSNTTIVLECENALIKDIYTGGSTETQLRVFLFNSTLGYSNEISNVTVTNEFVYIPFPTDITNARGQFGVTIVDTVGGVTESLFPALEVFSDLPENRRLLTIESTVLMGDTLSVSYYNFTGITGEYTFRILTQEGRVVMEKKDTLAGVGEYPITVDLSQYAMPQGVYFLSFTAGTQTERRPVIYVK